MKITCDIIADLMPLVKDGIACEDSTKAVLEHIETCENCKEEFGIFHERANHDLDDKRIIGAIKRTLFFIGFSALLIGSVTGIVLSNSMGMFYNFIIMPMVGVLGFYLLKNKWFIAPIAIFALSYIWIFMQNIIDGVFRDGFRSDAFLHPLFLSGIYGALVLLGIVIAFLFKIAFQKDKDKDKEIQK